MKKKKYCIIKRHGKEQKYDERKVYASVYAAALNCHYSEQKSEKIAKSVTSKITAWIKNKDCIDSDKIRDKVLAFLKDKDVKLMYKHHLDLS